MRSGSEFRAKNLDLRVSAGVVVTYLPPSERFIAAALTVVACCEEMGDLWGEKSVRSRVASPDRVKAGGRAQTTSPLPHRLTQGRTRSAQGKEVVVTNGR